MTCSKCKKTELPDVEYASLKYCTHHFMELMEKRVRKHLRTTKKLSAGKEFKILEDESCEQEITEYFLKKIFGPRIILKKTKKAGKNTIIPTNLDREVQSFLDEFIKNKKMPEKGIKPLEVLTKNEIKLISNIKKIKCADETQSEFLEQIEKKYPGTKFSAFKSKENIKKK